MGLAYFWFVAAAIIGALNLYFGNILLLIVSAACFLTGIFSFFFASIYFQITILSLISLTAMLFVYFLSRYHRNVDSYSQTLRRYVGDTVTVHEWVDNRYAKVQYDGKVWDAEIAFSTSAILSAGKYKIWKVLPNRLVLIR